MIEMVLQLGQLGLTPDKAPRVQDAKCSGVNTSRLHFAYAGAELAVSFE